MNIEQVKIQSFPSKKTEKIKLMKISLNLFSFWKNSFTFFN